tara:strand:+ start:881 stop:1171 length:291 start_codon:yes stop_codon:yes gene_type:complete
MTDLRQAAQQALKALELSAVTVDSFGAQKATQAAITALRAALEQQAEPPQRQWVGLTDEEMSDTVADMDVDFGDLLWKVVCLTKIIEAKLKERNGY